MDRGTVMIRHTWAASSFSSSRRKKFCNRALETRFRVWHRTFPFRFVVNVVKARHEYCSRPARRVGALPRRRPGAGRRVRG